MNKITGLLVDVENNVITQVTIDDTLEEFYKLIKCDIIDIAKRKVGDKIYNFIVDDNGLLKDEIKVAAIDPHDMENVLVGNVLIFNNVGPELTSLTDADFKNIKDHLLMDVYRKEILPIVELNGN